MEQDPGEIYDQEYDYYQDDSATLPYEQQHHWPGISQTYAQNAWENTGGFQPRMGNSQQYNGGFMDTTQGQPSAGQQSRPAGRLMGFDGVQDERPGPPNSLPGLKSMGRSDGPDNRAAAPDSTTNKSGHATPNAPDKSADLSDLKARVIASMQRSRVEHSNTPSGDKPGDKRTLAAQSLQLERPSIERKDSRTDLDGLLAEGKAAAEAGKKAPTYPGTAQGGTRQPQISTNGKTTEVTAKKAHNGPESESSSDEDSSEGSEQGEIREDEDEKPPKKSPETARQEAQRFKTVPAKEQKPENAPPLSQEQVKAPEKPTKNQPPAAAAKPVRKENEQQQQRPSQIETRDPRLQGRYDDQEYARTNRAKYDYGDRANAERPATSRPYPPKAATKVRERNPRREYDPRGKEPVYIDEAHYETRPGPDAHYETRPRPAKEPRPVKYAEEDRQLLRRKTTDSEQADLETWLEMTGYHDVAYRKDALRRHRELQALDAKRAELALEARLAQEERAGYARAQSVALDSSEAGSPHAPKSTRSSSVFAMPPPPARKRDVQEPALKRSSTTLASYRDPDTPQGYVKSPVEYSGQKRRYYSDSDDGPADKYVRVDERRHAATREEEEYMDLDEDGYLHRHQPSSRPLAARVSSRPGAREYIEAGDEDELDRSARKPLVSPQSAKYAATLSPDKARDEGRNGHSSESSSRSRGSNGYVRGGYSSRGGHRPSFGQDPASEEDSEGGGHRFDNHHHPKYPASERGRGRGRGGYFNNRGGRWNNTPTVGPRYGRQDTISDLALDKGDSRFFIIKSYNHDNVYMAQEENVWMTQERNAEIFQEALQTCRNVIFIFSVNKSMAFQGYARMESAPGSAPIPAWARDLLWKSSEPFRIRWITIAETRFSTVGHLKNAYNENQACLVARDGQEVERGCAVELCRLIDEEADRAKF